MATVGISAANNLEKNIRTLAQTKRIRVTEFFQDFDKLRSGFVTEPQFFRCLWQTLAVKLSPKEETALIEKYGTTENGQINYKQFCEEIDQNFIPQDINRNPVTQIQQAAEFPTATMDLMSENSRRTSLVDCLGTVRSVRPLSPESESRIVELLKRMQDFYSYHGINLRTCYEDFDRHHRGVVTESQFYRNFPGPPEVTEGEMHTLVSKYGDPDKPGLLNYLNLHHDIVAIGQQVAMAGDMLPLLTQTSIDFVPAIATPDPALNLIFDKIRVAVFKNGIRTIEFFKDHDKLRSGIITENQFVCGLALAVGKEAQLSRQEIQKIVEYYRQSDGRVMYKEFCDVMENAFNIPDLEKKPLQTVVRPPKGTLFRGLKDLKDTDEHRLHEVLNEISDQVRRRRLMMYPYFKDYDRGKGYTRVVTKTQFSRILHFLSLNVAPEDLKLLCKKFEDPASGDINYPAFVQAVDKEFVGHTMDDVDIKDKKRTNSPVPEIQVDHTASNVNLEDLLVRIRHIVLTNRLRVIEYFQDYDLLRSGSISKTQFHRGLGILGLSKLGQHDLTEGQFQLLCHVYQNPAKQDHVLWVKFKEDIESVFTEQNLEKTPTYTVPPAEIYRAPKPGTVDFVAASDDHKILVGSTMERLRQRTNQRRVLVKPVLQDFDKHNNGHVTRSQFRQCLTILELHATEAEMSALEAKYCNDVGFNYILFLEELQPREPPKLMYLQRMEDLRVTNEKKTLPEINTAKDLESVLLKVKTKVIKERIRVLEFMRDYDKLRHGRMLKMSFRRALDLCRFELRESEVSFLEDKYQSDQDPEYVDYLKFCDEVESIFTTKELEKKPLQEVVQFCPPEEWQLNKLEPKAEETFVLCMQRLSEKVRKHRMQLFPLFEDYDRVHNGTVSRSQFRRVLSELELGSLVNEQEFGQIWQKFDVKIGGKDDVNYIAFCDMIYDLAHFEWRKP